ncbi:MAG: O-antigen ligase family protein [Acidobacteriota bacterium]
MKILATLITAGLVAALFYLAREKDRRTSWALWIPVIWLLIVSSRPVSMWLQVNREMTLSDRYTEGSPLDAAVYGLLIVAAGLVLNRRAAQVRQFLRINLPVLLFFAYCIASVAWSDDPAIAIKRCVKAVGDILMVLVVVTDPQPAVAIRRMFARVGFVLLPMSILFIKYYPAMGSAYNQTDRVMMYFGVTTFKNLLGVLCMFSGLGALWSFIRAYLDRAMEHRGRHLIAQGALVLMAVWLIIKADSMTSLSCLALAGGVMVGSALPRISRNRAAVSGLVFGAIGFALFALFLSTGAGLLHSIGRNSTLTGRTQIWAAVLAQHTNPLIGTGYESFWMGNRMQSVWDMSQVGIEEAHNGYLEMYLNLGWLGIALLGLLTVTGYRNAMTLLGRDPHAARLRLALLTAGLIYSCTEAGFRMMSPTWIGFLLSVTAIPAFSRAASSAMPASWEARVNGETRILR